MSQPPVRTEHPDGRAGRRAGFLIGALVNGILLYLVNVQPGWQAVPFLTEDMAQVLGLVNLSLVLGVVTNLANAVTGSAMVRSLGEVMTTGVALAVLVRLASVFPFDLPDDGVDWAPIVRGLLVLLALATALGLLVQVFQLGRLMVTGR